MAGLGGLASFIQYQGQLQQQEQAKQQQQMQLQAFQQQQQDRQRQQAAMAAAGNALPQLLAGGQVAAQPQMPPPPQPPAPGQASQPAQQPMPQAGGGVPLPPGQPGAQQAQRPPLPPFRPMPTTPLQSAAPQGAIPAPPQPAQAAQTAPSGPLSLESAVKLLKDQGLSGADLMAGLQQLQPILDTQAKAQAAAAAQAFDRDYKVQTLEERAREADQRSKDTQASIVERAQAASESAQMRLLIAQMIHGGGRGGGPAEAAPDVKPDAQGNLPAPKAVGGYTSDAIKALGEDWAQRGSAAFSGMGRGKGEEAVRAAAINYGTAVNNQKGGNVATNVIQNKADTAGARSNAVQAAKVDAAANALVQPGGIGDQFQQATDALNRTGVPIANEAQMAILRRTNDPRVAAYDAAQNGVVSEAAQILGRGTLTVNSMEEARRVVNGWKTSEQTKAGLAQLKREAATTVKASSEEVSKSARTPKGQPGAAGGTAIPQGWSVTEH
jgi:hypothetical protein